MHRRTFLKTAAYGAAAMTLVPRLSLARDLDLKTLRVTTRTIDVNGRSATVYGIVGPTGKSGITLNAGDDFAVRLENGISDPTLVHWHGLTPPWPLDGVPDAPAPMIPPGESRGYVFPVGAGGTYWMHAHTLQEQRMLAAPLIVRTAEERAADEQEIVLTLHDFSFLSPEEILAGLKKPSSGSGMDGMDMSGMDMGAMDSGTGMSGMRGMEMSGPSAQRKAKAAGTASMTMDINDFDFDAYLANDRTLADPEVVRVERGGRVRLRIVNAAAATAFTIDTGSVPATLVAVDGQAVAPFSGTRFPLSMAQRVDLRLTVPPDGGSFSILALREGAVERTGIVLATSGAAVRKIGVRGRIAGPVLDLAMEASLRALKPLVRRKADRTADVELGGSMSNYRWSMSPGPLGVRKGERVEVTLVNTSMMSHPIHLHGHQFQVVAIDRKRFSGAIRDTVLVPPKRSVTFAVDADNPGQWAFHCHHLYHMATGMMSTFGYATS